MNGKKNNSYLKFDMSRMVNLEYSLDREILRTNRRGAYHCTTLVECNTRKQHGLLVMPVPNLGNSNHVILSSLDETVIQHGAEFNLGIHKYDGNNYSPMGHKYIREFDCDSLPRTIYRVGGVILSKEKMFSLQNNRILIRYTLIDAHSATTIRFKPYLAFREINQLTQENSVANHGYKEIENGISMCMYTGYPDLFMQFSKKAKFVFEPNWHRGIEYTKDYEENLPYKEDLYVPGYFELPIKKGESIIFAGSDLLANPEDLIPLFENGIKIRTPRSSFKNSMTNSAHQFYHRPASGGLYIQNGYPWGEISAREQFMSLPGLTLSIGHEDIYEEILDTALPTVENFLEGKPTDGYIRNIADADVLFWMMRGMRQFFKVNPERFFLKYGSLIKRIVTFIKEGKHPNIIRTENNLLYTPTDYGRKPSWMHNYLSEEFYTPPRTGYLVEINALWYNSLMFCAEIAELTEDNKTQKEMSALAEKVKISFSETFLNDAGYLYDYVDGGYVDWNVRPNMLVAIAADYALLDKRQSKKILDIITKELLTSKGLRTLSPKGVGFCPKGEGTLADKIYSSYNGAAWPAFFGMYMEAYLKIFQQSGLSFLERLLIGVEDEMANGCIGSLSAIYDSAIPYAAHGPISYAISVAGVLRALEVQESFEDKY